MSENSGSKDNAILVISQHCSHCESVLKSFSELVKEGVLARLEILNIEKSPDFATEKNIRSVPWFEIGALDFQGLHSKAEIQSVVENANTLNAKIQYCLGLLENRELTQLLGHIQRDGSLMAGIFELLGDAQVGTNIRLGIGVLMEELESEGSLFSYVDPLTFLASHESSQVRADACHYLSFTGNPLAVPVLEACLDDLDGDVREIARDSLKVLRK